MTTPAGWYPSGDGNERYWDGSAWTDQSRVAPTPPPLPAATSPALIGSPSVPWYRRTWVIAVAALLLGIGIGAAGASAGSSDEKSPSASSSEEPDETENEVEPPQDEVTPDPEPAAEPAPDGEYEAGCDYLLDPYKFTADASIDNTGNIGAKYQLQVEWYLTGGKSIKMTKSVMIKAGDTKRIGIERPASLNEIDAHQSYSGGESCTAEVAIVSTFGAVS